MWSGTRMSRRPRAGVGYVEQRGQSTLGAAGAHRAGPGVRRAHDHPITDGDSWHLGSHPRHLARHFVAERNGTSAETARAHVGDVRSANAAGADPDHRIAGTRVRDRKVVEPPIARTVKHDLIHRSRRFQRFIGHYTHVPVSSACARCRRVVSCPWDSPVLELRSPAAEEGAQPSSPARPESGAEPFGEGYQIVRLVRPDRVPGGREPPDAAPVVRDRHERAQSDLGRIASSASRPTPRWQCASISWTAWATSPSNASPRTVGAISTARLSVLSGRRST